MAQKYDIAVVGLAVMGQNLILNMSDHKVKVVAYNRTTSKVDDFLAGPAKDFDTITGAHSIEEMVEKLASPRRIMLMVRAGDAVDAFIDQVTPLLDKGDIIIDGGNSNYEDTVRREADLRKKGLIYLGTGVSGGEEGARFGPSIMPGGNKDGWPYVKDIFQGIAAKTEQGEACCDWVGSAGAGHFVKMVHNGIEYGDMQLIAETYTILRQGLQKSNSAISAIFKEWNKGILDSYLVEITGEILARKDEETSSDLVDVILDKAGQKGTGKWTVMSGADNGIPLTLITEAVYARSLSARLDERKIIANIYPQEETLNLTDRISQEDLEQALFAAKVISYTQGMLLIDTVNKEKQWDINLGNVALMWRGGCIIRSQFLGEMHKAYQEDPQLFSLLAAPYFADLMRQYTPALRKVVAAAIEAGIAVPALAAAITFFDGYRTARGSANILQAQRDYFGAHTYERIDKPAGQWYHTDWIESGAGVSSSTYNA